MDSPATSLSMERVAEWRASLTEAVESCASVRDVAAPSADVSKTVVQGSGSWSPQQCVRRVVELRAALASGGAGCYETDEAIAEAEIDAAGGEGGLATLRLLCLACTTHLDGEARFEAMALAAKGGDESSLAALLAYVEGALRQETARKLAVKALKTVGDELTPPEAD